MSTKFFEHAGGKIAYDETGAGPLVVCVPGMGELRGTFRILVRQLAEAGYQVVTMDVRGHGESSVDWDDFSAAAVGADIVALLRHLDRGPAAVVGNSLGAGAAIWAAAQAPGLVERLALLGPAVRGDVDGPAKLLYSILFGRPWGLLVWKKYYRRLYPSRLPADFAEYSQALIRNLAQPGRLEALRKMVVAPKSTLADAIRRARVPALVVMGSQDPDFKDPQAEAAWVTAQLHGACVLVEGAGHYPQTEFPEFTGPRVIEYLKSRQQETRFVETHSA